MVREPLQTASLRVDDSREPVTSVSAQPKIDTKSSYLTKCAEKLDLSVFPQI